MLKIENALNRHDPRLDNFRIGEFYKIYDSDIYYNVCHIYKLTDITPAGLYIFERNDDGYHPMKTYMWYEVIELYAQGLIKTDKNKRSKTA